MDYVNERTGEVLEVEKVTLSNLSSGALSRMFTNELQKLTTELIPGGKPGSINISVKAAIVFNEADDAVLRLEPVIGTKYPKTAVEDSEDKIITDTGEIVQKIEQNMFVK